MKNSRILSLFVVLLVALCLVNPALAQELSIKPRPRIALVLGGGGARGGAHVGVLKVLEQMRVPVDFVVGTSMGAVIGGAYASGLAPADMEKRMVTITTQALLSDGLPRPDQPLRIKSDDFQPYIGPEFGMSRDGLLLRKGVVSGISIEAVVRSLVRTPGELDFDDLPIPFRAVATDIETAEMVVLESGDLSTAIRASMAVPGVLSPVEIDGRALVDGGLARNLPVDVARKLGADVIIAVNLALPLQKRSELKSLLGISSQVINMLTVQNVRVSLDELNSKDILITPALGAYSAADFDHIATTVAIGENAAQAAASQLQALALTPQAYAEYLAQRSAARATIPRRIDRIIVNGTSAINPDVLLRMMHTQPGQPFQPAMLDDDLRRIYGEGDLDSIDYRIDTIDGKNVLNINVTERDSGPNHVRFGLALNSDLQGTSTFDLVATLRRRWLNPYGAELRGDVLLGTRNRIGAELYQPVGDQQAWFVAPNIEFLRKTFELYSANQRIASFVDSGHTIGLDAGYNLSSFGEARLGVRQGARAVSLETGPPDLASLSENLHTGGLLGQLRVDRLDSVRFPRNGYAFKADVYASKPTLGASDQYSRWEGDILGAQSWGNHTVQVEAAAGAPSGNHLLPFYEQFRLGGFLRMSGYHEGQIIGDRYEFARLGYQTRLLRSPLLEGAYLGVSLEGARMEHLISSDQGGPLRALAAWVAIDTPLGPLYFALASGRHGAHGAYLLLGVPGSGPGLRP